MKFKSFLKAMNTCIISGVLALPLSVQSMQPADTREALTEIIDHYEVASAQWSGTHLTEVLTRQLRQRVALVPDSEMVHVDEQFREQIHHLKDAVWALAQHGDGSSTPDETMHFMMQSQTSTSQFPVQEPIDVPWAIQIGIGDQDEEGVPSDTVGANGNCNSQTPASPELRYVLLNTHISLEAVKDTAAKVCDQVIAGTNLSLFCLISDIAYLIAAGINENVQLCEGMIDGVTQGANYDRLHHISGDIGDLSAGVSTRINQSSSTVNNALNNALTVMTTAIANLQSSVTTSISSSETELKTRVETAEDNLTVALEGSESAIINGIGDLAENITVLVNDRSDSIDTAIDSNLTALDDFRDENLRLHIEKNLGDTSGPVALFQLPGSFGGHLELVDLIVRDTIDEASAHGHSTDQAERDYTRARDFLDELKFKDSYRWYRAAYKAVNRTGT